MRVPIRHALLGSFAALLLAAMSGGAWHVASRTPAAPGGVEEGLPAPPPAPSRLSDESDYVECLDSLAMDAQAALVLAEAWRERGGGEGFRHCAALALQALGEPESAAAALEALAARTVAAAARSMIYGQAAQAWIAAGRPERAHDVATAALTIAPNDPDLLMDRAVAGVALGRFDGTLVDATRAAVVDAGRPDAWMFRALALRHLDHAQEALRDVEHALSLAPSNPEAMLERGILRQLNGDLGGARADWEWVVRMAPESVAADLAHQNLALSEAGPTRR